MEKFISIINTPAASSGDCVVSGNTVTITGLKPFSTTDLISLKVNKCLFPTGMRYVATQALTAGDTFRFSITQSVNSIVETVYFSYVVDTYANLSTAISNFISASGIQVTAAVSGGSLAGFVLTLNGISSNVVLEVGGSVTTSAGLTSGVTFVYTAPTTLTSCTTAAGTTGARIQINKTSHGLKNGQIVTISSFDNNAAAFNGGVYRVTYVSANAFTLSYLTGALVLCGATTTAATTGTVVLIAADEYGTATQVNAEAASIGSTQTATNSTSYYSCVEIVGSYLNTNTGNLVQRQSFTANVWYTEAAAAGTTAPSADVLALEATLSGLVKA